MCADWSGGVGNRAVYVANVPDRVVYRVSSRFGWSVASIIEEAYLLASKGTVLAAFDAPLGVPESYLASLRTIPQWKSTATFLDFLPNACATPGYFDATIVAENWTPRRPFFSVPAGKGGLTSYIQAAAKHGVNLYRSMDARTRAKTLFAKSGIPGSVGSATCSLWRELGPLLDGNLIFRVWPFDGDMKTLVADVPVVLGEIYPRAAYATALLNQPCELRPPLSLAKTDPGVRFAAIEALKASDWVRANRVTIANADYAQSGEDDFDACMTAAALLRCELDQAPLSSPLTGNSRIEGSMLGTGSVNLRLSERTWGAGLKVERSIAKIIPVQTGRTYRCPIPDCDKVFVGSRGGWDGHVGSNRLHPLWHPEITSAEGRKARFAIEFAHFFE